MPRRGNNSGEIDRRLRSWEGARKEGKIGGRQQRGAKQETGGRAVSLSDK
jgi:hypothetical protein